MNPGLQGQVQMEPKKHWDIQGKPRFIRLEEAENDGGNMSNYGCCCWRPIAFFRLHFLSFGFSLLELIPRYLIVNNILESPITPPATPLMTKIRDWSFLWYTCKVSTKILFFTGDNLNYWRLVRSVNPLNMHLDDLDNYK